MNVVSSAAVLFSEFYVTHPWQTPHIIAFPPMFTSLIVSLLLKVVLHNPVVRIEFQVTTLHQVRRHNLLTFPVLFHEPEFVI